MAARHTGSGSTRALVGACLVVAVLLVWLAWLEGRGSGLACAPMSPASNDGRDVVALDVEPATLLGGSPTPDASALLTARAAELGVVSGVVVDDITGEAVPFVDVQLEADGGGASVDPGATVRTDENGAFRFTHRYTAGRIAAVVSDAGAVVARVPADREQARGVSSWTIPVPIGPTVTIESVNGRAPVSTDLFRARLVETRLPVGSAGEITVLPDDLKITADREDRDWGWKPLRFERGVPFARWPLRLLPVVPAFDADVCLESEPRLLAARVRVACAVGIQHTEPVEADPFAIVSGKIALRGDSSRPTVQIFVCDDVDDRKVVFESPPSFAWTTSNDGAYSVHTSVTRSKRIGTWAQDCPLRVALVSLPGPEARTFDDEITFAPAKRKAEPRNSPPAPPVSLADVRQFARVRSHALGHFGPASVLPIAADGAIDLSGVPIGRTIVESIAFDETPRLGESVESNLPENVPTAMTKALSTLVIPHRINVRSPQTLAEIAAGPAGALITTQGKKDNQGKKDEQPWLLSRWNPVDFTVWAPGFSPTLLDRDSFRAVDGELVADVELQRGWGVYVSFRVGTPTAPPPEETKKRSAREPAVKADTAKGKKAVNQGYRFVEALAAPPLAGVRVFADGHLIGTSAVDGCVLLRQALQPLGLSLAAKGWRMSGLVRIPGPGSRWFVWMRRDP